ncbi:MAG: hypothetical protein U1E17_21360 [Geminicoccaceae bacterium]
MSYGPGYVLWQQILRERAERRAARLEARRADAAANSQPAAALARGRRRGRPPKVQPGRSEVNGGSGSR